MIKFTEDHEAMIAHTEKRLTVLEGHAVDATCRLTMLESFKKECDELHRNGEVKQRRQEDAINRNTESTILLAKAVADINITITKLSAEVDGGQPVIDFWSNAGKAWTFNKMMLLGIVGLFSGVGVIIAVLKSI